MAVDIELEVTVKVPRPLTEEDVNDIDINRLIGKPQTAIDLEDDTRFDLKRFVINLADVRGRGEYDGAHTMVYMTYGTLLINTPFEEFNAAYEILTGRTTRKVSEFRFVEETELPRKKQRK